MLYQKIIEKLHEKDIKYLVVGGIAVNLYGYIRATADLDILILLDHINTAKFVEITKELGYKPRVPVNIDDFSNASKRESWIKEKNMKVFSVYNPNNTMEHIDVLIENYIDFDKAFERREVIKLDNTEINLINIDDLIKLKKVSGRDRDMIDIKALTKIKELKNENG
ncbi:MAG: hypothetical protein C4562_03655 [Actinobacteria bacterium]|nr:MAG: hypothetical protein C4562_03655 [Actinomycetota bacterium]